MPPMIVSNTLTNHSLINLLATSFRVIPSPSTPKDSLQFPSFQSSCLVLDTDISITKDLIDFCLGFLSSNTNPFIILSPSTFQTYSVEKVSSLANYMVTTMAPLSLKVPIVVGTATINIAHSVILDLVTMPNEKFPEQLNPTRALDKETHVVKAMVESGICKDRVDSILLLSQIGSLNKLLKEEKDLPMDVREWLMVDKEE